MSGNGRQHCERYCKACTSLHGRHSTIRLGTAARRGCWREHRLRCFGIRIAP